MKIAFASVACIVALAGCGGSAQDTQIGGELTPGYYVVSGSIQQPSSASRTLDGRLSVTSDGTVRLFGIDSADSRVTLSRTAGQVNPDGTNTNASFNGLASTGDLSTLVDNLVSFSGTGFALTANGDQTSLPSVGISRVTTAGTYRGELVRVVNGVATDWGTASGTLSITTPTAGPPVKTLQASLVSTANTANGTFNATLVSDGTATSSSATSGGWSSDGNSVVLRLSGGAAGNGNLFVVLARQTP